MLANFAIVLVFLIFGLIVVFSGVLVPYLLAPSKPYKDKLSIYECGERPLGPAWIQFNIRFYVIALIFLIFDVELAVIFPCAVVYGEWVARGSGLIAFFEIAIFILVLFVGLVYAWVKGDFAWVKTIASETNNRKPEMSSGRED